MKNILTDKGRDFTNCFCERSTLFCFDFDGTLAPIVEEPSDVQIPQNLLKALNELSTLAAVAVISGRLRSDLEPYVTTFAHFTFGNHGAQDGVEIQERADVASWKNALNDTVSLIPGVWIEDKGQSLSLHYRQAKGPSDVMRNLEELSKTLVPSPKIIGGKFVLNLVPEDLPTKSHALLSLMTNHGFPKAIFLGDDINDEDVFSLKDPRILGIRIGKDSLSQASYFLHDQHEVELFLSLCLSKLKQGKVPKKNLETPLFG